MVYTRLEPSFYHEALLTKALDRPGMCFKLRGELLYCKKWAESLTPGNKFRFLNCSRAENFFFNPLGSQPRRSSIGF